MGLWHSTKNETTSQNSTVIFFYTLGLFGSLNHFGQNVLHLVPKQKREEKRRRKL